MKIAGWEKINEAKKEIRRPLGYRTATITIWRNDKRDEALQLLVMPRRPQYYPYGNVKVNDELIFEGTKQEAEEYAIEYMKKHSTEDSQKARERICPACHGTGEGRVDSYGTKYDCNECGGTGSIPADRYS